jgi:hypothetical protein
MVTLHADECEAARALMGMYGEEAEMGGVGMGMETASVGSGDTEVEIWEDDEDMCGA